MVDLVWVASVTAGAICFGAGLLGWMKSPRSPAAGLFLLAMSAIFVATATGSLYPLVDASYADAAETMAKTFVVAALLAMTFLWEVTIVFPINRRIAFWPPNRYGFMIVAGIVLACVLGGQAELDYDNPLGPTLTPATAKIFMVYAIAMIALASVSVLLSRLKANDEGRRSSMIFLIGLWVLFASGFVYAIDFTTGHEDAMEFSVLTNASLVAGLSISGLLFAVAIARGQMVMVSPSPEKFISSSKAQYKLLHRRVYLVLEEKPDFSMKMFSDILKSRCFDCLDDESFPCESLDCSSCSLPCPCRTCKKYTTRAQGLIVTRQYPKDVRTRYYIQTTPMLWLSTVAGKDNMDPAKLSLLTDFLVSFMERSQNGVVLVDGLEYLVTSNDFLRVLKSIDRWTETAMASRSRLIMSIDPKAFDPKELALLERNREVVRPDAKETWQIIPERI